MSDDWLSGGGTELRTICPRCNTREVSLQAAVKVWPTLRALTPSLVLPVRRYLPADCPCGAVLEAFPLIEGGYTIAVTRMREDEPDGGGREDALGTAGRPW